MRSSPSASVGTRPEAASEPARSRRVGERLPASRRRDRRAGGAASARLHGPVSSRLRAFAPRVAAAPRWRSRATSTCRPRCTARIGAGARRPTRDVAWRPRTPLASCSWHVCAPAALQQLRRAARRAAAEPLSGLGSARSALRLVSRSVGRIRGARDERVGRAVQLEYSSVDQPSFHHHATKVAREIRMCSDAPRPPPAKSAAPTIIEGWHPCLT